MLICMCTQRVPLRSRLWLRVEFRAAYRTHDWQFSLQSWNLCPSAAPPSELCLFSDFTSHQTEALYPERVKRGRKREQSAHPFSILPSPSFSPAMATVTWPNKVSQEKGSGMTEGEREESGDSLSSPLDFFIIPPSPFWIPLTISCTALCLRANGLYLANLQKKFTSVWLK